MPLTAFSKTFQKELDVDQLLKALSLREGIVGNVSAERIQEEWRTFIRDDLECPCCFVSGAEVVRQAVSRSTGRAIRQSCFRFLTPGHHSHCDFTSNASTNSIPENLVSFSAANSKLTRAVRELVCAGIQINAFNQSSIRDMRHWFFQKKADSLFEVTLDPSLSKWINELRRAVALSFGNLPTGVSLSAEIASVPGFDWRLEAARRLHKRHENVLDTIQREKLGLQNIADRIEILAKRYRGQITFDPTVLETEYEKSKVLAAFISRNYAPIRAGNRDGTVAVAVLALSALLLYVSEWNLNQATSAFATIAAAVGGANQDLGNVMGLNPFHDYEAWRTLKRLQKLGIMVPDNADPNVELREIETDLRAKFQVNPQK